MSSVSFTSGLGVLVCLGLSSCVDVDTQVNEAPVCGARKCDSSLAVARGISLHVGVNEVDWSLPVSAVLLAGAERDAVQMQEIAIRAGFEPQVLLGPEATADEFIASIKGASDVLVDGDTFLLSFSGHGLRAPDENGDEIDQRDEMIALYDRPVVDDEIRDALAAFATGVQVVIIVDACHSATIADCPEGSEPHEAISATVLSLSASQDFEEALDGRYGAFTGALLDAGGFSDWPGSHVDFNYLGDYKQLHLDLTEILTDPAYSQLPPQHPAIHVCGPESEELIKKVAFDFQPWKSKDELITSAHPYANNLSEDYVITAPPGTTAFRLNFRRIATRYGGDDVVEVYDGDGAKVASYGGRAFNRLSPAIVGERATVRLVTDDYDTSWGFEIDRIDYR